MSVELSSEQERAVIKFTQLIQQGEPGGIAWWLMGEGKSRIALETWRRSGLKYLLIATRRAAFDGWREEVVKCQIPCLIEEAGQYKSSYFDLWNGPEVKFKFVALQTADSLHKLPVGFNWTKTMVVLDELYLFGNPKSLRSKRAQLLTNKCIFTLGLSATIMPAKDNTTIFGQAKSVGLHHHLGRTLTNFRTEFQNRVFSPFTPMGEWVNMPHSKERILYRLSPFVDSHFPDKKNRNIRSQVIYVKQSAEQQSAIKNLKETWSLNGQDFNHTLSIARKIQQIGNGWVETSDSEEDLLCYNCPKAERLIALVDELIAAGEKVVIWCAFRNDIEFLASLISHPVLVFIGGTKFDSVAWKTNNIKIILATVANGASVNHFANVGFAIYYSLSYRWLELQQSQGRHERKNSQHGGAFYYFLLNGPASSLDSHIYKTVSSSRDVERDVIETAVRETLTENC